MRRCAIDSMEQNRSTHDVSHHYGVTYLDAIDHQRRLFSGLKTDLLSRYLERDRKSIHTNPRLVSMNGWGNSLELIHSDVSAKPKLSMQAIQKLFRGEESMERWGGFWLSLGGQGIAINPGSHFLQRFHNAELHVWDIDHVIITDGTPEASLELERLWTLNREINALLRDWGLEPHVIHYWLHPKAFDRYGAILRPIYRQEQGSVHRLDMFQDTTSFETTRISSELSVTYAAYRSSKESKGLSYEKQRGEHSYALRIDWKPNETTPENEPPFSIAFFLQTPWHESYSPLLQGIDTAVLGVGELNFEEIAKLSHDEKSLGYAGALSLLTHLYISSAHNTKIPAIIFAEYGMKEGDFRIECLKQLKTDIIRQVQEKEPTLPNTKPILLLPAEDSLSLSLIDTTLQSAPGLDEPTHISDISVLRSHGPFSRLTYVPKNSVL